MPTITTARDHDYFERAWRQIVADLAPDLMPVAAEAACEIGAASLLGRVPIEPSRELGDACGSPDFSCDRDQRFHVDGERVDPNWPSKFSGTLLSALTPLG